MLEALPDDLRARVDAHAVAGEFWSYVTERTRWRNARHALEIELKSDGTAELFTWQYISFTEPSDAACEAAFDRGPVRGMRGDFDHVVCDGFGCGRDLFACPFETSRRDDGALAVRMTVRASRGVDVSLHFTVDADCMTQAPGTSLRPLGMPVRMPALKKCA